MEPAARSLEVRSTLVQSYQLGGPCVLSPPPRGLPGSLQSSWVCQPVHHQHRSHPMYLSQAKIRYPNAIHLVPSTSQCQQHCILAFHTCTVGNEVLSNAGVPRTVLSSRKRVIEDLVLRSSLLVVGGPPAGMLKDLEGRFDTGMFREWLKATFFCGVGLSAGCSSKPAKSCIHNRILSVLIEEVAAIEVIWSFLYSSRDMLGLGCNACSGEIELEVSCNQIGNRPDLPRQWKMVPRAQLTGS